MHGCGSTSPLADDEADDDANRAEQDSGHWGKLCGELKELLIKA
jgi:hypothetical protein